MYIVLIAVVSKVILLVLLSNFVQYALPCAKFESSNTNRMTFEYAPNMMIVNVHFSFSFSTLFDTGI